MISKNPQIIYVMNKNWYIETQTGLDGPFESEQAAASRLDKVKQNITSPLEFAGLQFTLGD